MRDHPYKCIECGTVTRIGSGCFFRASRPKCSGCGSTSLTRTNQLPAYEQIPNRSAGKSPKKKSAIKKRQPRSVNSGFEVGARANLGKRPKGFPRKQWQAMVRREAARLKFGTPASAPQSKHRVYLSSSLWKNTIRPRIIARDRVCQCCQSESQLRVCFRSYTDAAMAGEDDSQLIVLCSECNCRYQFAEFHGSKSTRNVKRTQPEKEVFLREMLLHGKGAVELELDYAI